MAQAFNLTAQLNLRGPSNIKTIVADIKRQLGTVQGTVNFTIDPKTTRNVSQLESALRNLNTTFAQTQNNATAAANAIRTFNNAIGNISSATNNINRNMNNAATATQNLGKQTTTAAQQTKAATSEMEEFGKQSALAVRRFAAFSSVTSIIFAFTNALTKGMTAFVAFDKEFVKLQQVTDSSASQLKGLSDEITSLSKNFGVASSDLMTVASTLAQAGLTAKDTERALKALALTDLAPSFDSMNDTVEGSIALMRQFNIGAKDLEKALGSINSVAAVFAVEASDIITAIQRTGGVFASASKGVSQGTDALNEFIAVFTSVRQTTRESAETIATGLRTIFTRIQRESTIEALREFGVVLTDLEGKFVGPYEAVKKLSEGLSNLDPRDLKFSQIVEELGGFRQIGKVIPLIQQFATAQEALGVAQRGQGSLAQDAVKAQLSLANQMSKVREEFLALMRDVGNSDTFQAIAKSALGFTSVLIKVADSVKGILPVLAIMGAGKAASGIAQFATGFIGGLKKGPDGQAGGSGGGGGGGGIISRMTGGGGGNNQSNIGVRELILVSDALRNNTSSLGLNTAAIQDLTRAINNSGRSPFANGGMVRKFARGGVVPGSGDRDTVPAMLQPGEFVIRKKAVETIGADNLHSMNKYGSGGSIRAGRSNKRKKFASGGPAISEIKSIDDVVDGDTFDAEVVPKVEPYKARFRLLNYDAFETGKRSSKITPEKWNKIKQFKSNNGLEANQTSDGSYKIPYNTIIGRGGLTASSAGDKATDELKQKINDTKITDLLSKVKSGKSVGFGRIAIDLGKAVSDQYTTGRYADDDSEEYAIGGIVKKFMAGGKAKETRSFGSGDFPFPKRISNAYFKELDAILEKEQVEKAFSGGLGYLEHPSEKRIKVESDRAMETFDSTPLDKAAFAESFKKRISALAVYKNMSNFAKFIGLPREDLSLVLPEYIDFSSMGSLGPLGQFDRTGMGKKYIEGYDLSSSGFGKPQEQDLYGYEKLVAEKQKEMKKIIKTPVKTFDDGSFRYDEEAAKKTWDEINDLQMKIMNLKSNKMKAEASARDQIQATAAKTGRGTVSINSGTLIPAKNDTFYHELTHQLFQGLRTRSSETFDKYKARVISLFDGDNNDLADAFDALENSYNSADVVYGRSYKIGLLDQVIQQNKSINRGSKPAKTPEAQANAVKFWSQSLGIKKARDFRPINPDVNQTLLDNSIAQSTIDRVEDSGKEEFLTTLVQNGPKLDSNLQGVLDSTLNDLLGSAGITRQKYGAGGQVLRNIGVVDTDVLRDPANASIVRAAMEKLGITDVSDYTTKLGELAAKARKSGSLSKFRAIAGAAGSGKSSLATGKGANDDATLRKTTRSQILTPEDIEKVNEVIVLTSTASQAKLDAYLKDVDRAYVLSSNSRDEQDQIRSNRDSRDATGEGLYGRKPGTTRGATADFGLDETVLRDELGKKATVLGRKENSFGLRRKKESELPEIIQAGGFYTGGFAPPTRGHRGALDTLLENMLAKNPSASLEDIVVSVAPDLPMIAGKEGVEHAARYGIFPADFRALLSEANFGDAMISTQDQPPGSLPKFMEVAGSGDRRKFARLKGAMAITSGKEEGVLGKYARAGMDVKDIPRIEDISATKVRDALFAGDDKTLTSFLDPNIASVLMGNRAQLRNRSMMVPMLIEEIQKFVDQEKERSNAEVSSLLSSARGGPYKNVSAKLKENAPEVVNQIQEIRNQRDRLSRGAFGYRAFNIIRALSAKYPEIYGLDPSRKSAVSAQPSDITKEAIAAQLSEQMSGEFGGVSTAMPSGLEEAILKNVEKSTQVKKSSGILPAQGSEILKRFGAERLPNDPSFGPFSGKTVRDTADGGKLKYWNSAFRPETKADKLAYYTATRDYLIDKFNQSQGTQKATTLAETTNAVLSSKQLGLVGLNPLGYTGLLGPETWNLGTDPSGQERSIDASIIQRGLPTQYQNVIDYLSGQTEELVGGAAKLLGISPKKLSQKERETLGQGNIEGALLEQIFGSAGATVLDDALRTRPIDFPMGIGSKAAKIFGIDPNIPTEVKRTIDSGSRSKAVEEFKKYFRQQYGIPEPTEEAIQKLAAGGPVKLYHGSNTGTDDSVLKSFKEKGALSNIAQGYGQGAGFFVYTEKDRAIDQAKMRVRGGGFGTVVSGDTTGRPMVLSFNEVLDPKTYDLDYELQKNLVTQWLHDNFDKIKDKAAPDQEKGIAGIRDIIKKDSSQGIMSPGIKTQSAEGSRKAIFAAGDSDIREAEILGQIMNRLQTGDPELVNSFEAELFKKPYGLVLKYVGSSPLKPSNIETFAKGGQAGISSQDTVPALLTPGEFVINKKAAQNIGYGKLNKLNKADKIQGYNKGGYVGIQKFAEGGGPSSVGASGPFIGFDFNDKILSQYTTQAARSLKAFAAAIDLALLKTPTLFAGGVEKVAVKLLGWSTVVDSLSDSLDKLDTAMPGVAQAIIDNGLANKRSAIGQESLIRSIYTTTDTMANAGEDYRGWLRGLKDNLESNTASITGRPADTAPSPGSRPYPEAYASQIDYSDVTGKPGNIGESGRKYATALSKEDPAKIEAVAQKLQAEFEAAMNSIGASISKWGKSQSWAKWDIGKQLHMNANPDESNSNYRLANPLEDAQLQKEMVQRMVGWETTGGGKDPNTGERMSSSALTAKGAEALSAARTSSSASVTSGLRPISDLADSWDKEEASAGSSSSRASTDALSSAKTNKGCCDCCDGSGGGAGSGSGSGDKKDDNNKANIDAKVLSSIKESQEVAKGAPNAKSTNSDFNQLLQLQGQLSNSMRKKLGPAFTEVSNAINAKDYNAAAKTLVEIRKQMGSIAKIPPVNINDLINFDTSNISSMEEASRVYAEMTDAIGRMRDSGQTLPPMFTKIADEVEKLGDVLADEATTLEEKANQLNQVNNDMKSMGANMPDQKDRTKQMQDSLNKAAMVVGLVGQAASNLFNDESKSGAIGKAVTSGASQTAGAGLALAGQALSLPPPLGPAVAALVAAGTAAVTIVGAFKDAHNAAREFEKTLASKNLQMAMDRVASDFEEFGKNIKNVKLLDNIENQLNIAGSNTQKGQDIENNVPKAFWVNMFDALGSSDKQAAADRSKILEKEGTFGYLRSTSMAGGESYRQSQMRSYAPEQSVDQAKAFKPVADATLQLFENKLNTGTSMDDVMKELKDATGAPTQLAKNIALANPAIQEEILLIKQNNLLDADAKRATIDNIIAKEAERKASADLERTLREVEINKLNKATNTYVNSLERTFKQMEASIGKATFELDNMTIASDAFNAALSGSAKASTVNLKSINVLQNSRAYSGSERDAAGKQAGAFFGATSGNLEGMLKVGDKLESNIISTINRTIQEDPNASEEKIAAKIRTNTESTVKDAGLSKDLSSKLATEVQKAVGDIRKGGDKGPVDFDQLVEKVPALSKTLDGARRAQELANKALEYWQKNLNEYANAMNQSMEMQLEANARGRRAVDIQVKGAMELQKALGKEVTLREQVSSVLDSTSRQTKGLSSPSAIGDNIVKLNDRRTVQQGMSDTAANRGTSGKNEFMDMQQRLRNTNMALRENYDALKNMAENTDIASAALSKINEVQQKRQAGVNIAEKLVTSSPEELSKLNSAMARLSNNMAGVQNVGTTADQRKESLDAFNMIAPLLGPDQGAMKANMLESMLGESGVGVSPMMKDVLDSLRNPEEDPMMREAIETYKMGVNLQSDANSELARMSQLMSDNTAEVAAEKIAQSLTKVELSFNEQVFDDIRTGIRRLVELEEAKKDNAQNAQGKARGGLIYAAAGQMVDFAPKGTDTVPAMLTPGEFVVNRAATQKNLPLLKTINSNKYSSGGKVRYYSDGGWVGIDNEKTSQRATNNARGIMSNMEIKETDESYPDIEKLPNKIAPLFTLDGGRVVAASKNSERYLSAQFLNKDSGVSTSIKDDSYSLLGPSTKKFVAELTGGVSGAINAAGRYLGSGIIDTAIDNQTFKGNTQIDGYYPGPRLKQLTKSFVWGTERLPTSKPIQVGKIEQYIKDIEPYITKLNLQELDDIAKNVKYELPSPPHPVLEFTDTGAILKNLSEPFSGYFGLFMDPDRLFGNMEDKPNIYGFMTESQAGPNAGQRGYAAVSAGPDNLYSALDSNSMSTLFGKDSYYVNPSRGPVASMMNTEKTDFDKTLSIMTQLDEAYKKLTGKSIKTSETQKSIDNKQYVRDLMELYYGTKLSATFNDKETLPVPDTDVRYPVTLYNPVDAIKEKWSQILEKSENNGVGTVSSLEDGLPLAYFNNKGEKTGDTKKFPYIDSSAASDQEISDILRGAQSAVSENSLNANVIDMGSSVHEDPRYMFTYQKIKARFFDDTSRRFSGMEQDLKEFVIIKKQSESSEALNPFVDLNDNQIVYGDSIESIIDLLNKVTPLSGQSGKPGAKPEEVEPYTYKLRSILKAKNNLNAATQSEKDWTFLKPADEPDLTLIAKAYTLAREKALLNNQLNEDKADVKKVFRVEDRDKKAARERKPGESDADYEARMKTVKAEAKAQAKEEAWTEAKRVTLGRAVYGVANQAGIKFNSALPVDIPTVGGVAVELGQYITKMPTDSPQRAMLDAYRAFFAELYNNGETAKSSKEAAEGSDSGSFLKSLGIDISDKAFGGPGPMIKVPGSTTETAPAYYTSTTNDAAKINAILARQFMAERSKQFAGALSDEKKEELTVDASEGGAKIYTVNPDGTKSLRKGDEIVPKSYADIFDIALTPENIFPDADIRQKYLDQLISYYGTAANAQGQALFTPEMSQPFVDSLNVLKTWYKVQDTVLNASRSPEQLLAIRGGLQAVKEGTIPETLQKQFQEITGLTVDDVKAKAEQARDEAQKANAFLTTNKYGELPDLERMIALLNVQAAEKAQEDKQQQTQALSSGGIVYASTGKLINFQRRGTDTVPAMLTPGEFVVNRGATQKHLPVLEAINSGNYSRGDIVKHLSSGGLASGYYQTGGSVGAGLAGFDFSSFMNDLVGQVSSAITEAAKSAFDSLAKSNTASGGVSNSGNQNFDGISEFTSKLDRISSTLASLDIPKEITITGKHDVNVIINGDQALSQLTPNIKDMVMTELKKGFERLVAINNPVPSDSLKSPYS